MINRVVLVGRMTKDPVLRKTGTGASVTSFTVACDRRIKTEGQPTADFINCVCWNKVADNTAQFTHKGSLVGVEGRIQTRNYEDQTGKRVYVTEVVCDSVQTLVRSNTEGQSNYQPSYQASAPADNSGYTPDSLTSYDNDFSTETLDIASDDLPF